MTSNLNLSDFHPVSKLVVKQTILQKPHCRVIDAHKHLGVHFGGGWANKSVAELTGRLDDAYVDVYVDLDGGWSEDILEARLRKFKEVAPVRFIFFGGPGWKHWQVDGDRFGE